MNACIRRSSTEDRKCSTPSTITASLRRTYLSARLTDAYFALPGCESRHNSAYWMLEDYVGLGALSDELRTLESEIAELETRWIALSEQLEA